MQKMPSTFSLFAGESGAFANGFFQCHLISGSRARTDMAKRTISKASAWGWLWPSVASGLCRAWMYFESKVQGVETPSQVRYVGYVWGLDFFKKLLVSEWQSTINKNIKKNQVERLLRKQAALEVPGLLHHGFTHQPFSRMRFSPSTVSTLTAPEAVAVRLLGIFWRIAETGRECELAGTFAISYHKGSLFQRVAGWQNPRPELRLVTPLPSTWLLLWLCLDFLNLFRAGQQLVAVVKDVHGQSHEAAPFLLNQLNEDQERRDTKNQYHMILKVSWQVRERSGPLTRNLFVGLSSSCFLCPWAPRWICRCDLQRSVTCHISPGGDVCISVCRPYFLWTPHPTGRKCGTPAHLETSGA